MEALIIPSIILGIVLIAHWAVIFGLFRWIKKIFKAHQLAIINLKEEHRTEVINLQDTHHQELQLASAKYNSNLISIKKGAYEFEKSVNEKISKFELIIKQKQLPK